MARKGRFIRKRRLETPQSKNQQRLRRRKNLFKKLYQYCMECEANASMLLQNRHNGRLFIADFDPTGNLLKVDFVCLNSGVHYHFANNMTENLLSYSREKDSKG